MPKKWITTPSEKLTTSGVLMSAFFEGLPLERRSKFVSRHCQPTWQFSFLCNYLNVYLIPCDDIGNQSSPLAPSASDKDSIAMVYSSSWYSMIWGHLYLEHMLAYLLCHFKRFHNEHILCYIIYVIEKSFQEYENKPGISLHSNPVKSFVGSRYCRNWIFHSILFSRTVYLWYFQSEIFAIDHFNRISNSRLKRFASKITKRVKGKHF